MPKKARTPIPAQTAALVLYRSDRTCCVCRSTGKAVQIHHLDEDPSNNDRQNLAVLCLDCHGETQLAGGFGRKLDAPQVILYRDGWYELVEASRADVASAVETTELTGGTPEGVATQEHLSDALNEVTALLPDWLDAVEIDPIVGAQFKATWDAYHEKIRRLRPGGPRFALEQRQASELLEISERHRSLVDIYAQRTEAMNRFVGICLDILDDHPDVWPLLAELDGGVQVAGDVIRNDVSEPIAPGKIHIYDFARQRVHQSETMARLFEVWRYLRRVTSQANATVMSWDDRLARHRPSLASPVSEQLE